MSNWVPDSIDVSLQRDQYSAACQYCPWSTAIKPSGDNGWWFHSLRVHFWHFCPAGFEVVVIPAPDRGNPRQ